MELKEQKITIKNKIYQYYDDGEGKKTILFLHGLGSSKKMYPRFFNSFLEDFRCVFIDLPAHNGIPDYGIDNLDQISEYIIDFIDFLEPKEIILIGFSFGGLVAVNTVNLMKKRGKNVKAVAWASPLKKSFLTLRSKSFFKIVDMVKKKTYKKLPKSIYFRFLVAVLGIKATNNDLETFQKFENSNLDRFEKLIPIKFLPTKNLKILYIFGTKDPLIKNSSFKQTKLTNKFQEKYLIKSGGHNLNKKAKKEIYDLIVNFINKEESNSLFNF